MAQLVERETAARTLAAALASARAGAGRTVLAFGEAGVGKSSLIRAWADTAPDARWLWGGCLVLVSLALRAATICDRQHLARQLFNLTEQMALFIVAE